MMSYVQRFLEICATVAASVRRNAGRADISSSPSHCRRALWASLSVFALVGLSACASSALHSGGHAKNLSKTHDIHQTSLLMKVASDEYVHWHTPKFVQLVDKKHVRVMFDGQAKPGIKIQIDSSAVSFDSHLKVKDLTFKEMAPSSTDLTVGPDQKFKILLTLPTQHVEIPFNVTYGALKQQNIITVLVSKDHIVQVGAKPVQAKKQSRWNFGIEVRSVEYSQTSLNNLNESALAANLSYQRALAKHWSFETRSFIDVITGTGFSTTAGEMSARFFGLGSDLVYHIPSNHKWSVGIAGGIYYSTMLPSGVNFGYTNLWEPELYPIFRYSLNSKNIYDFYLRYAPVDSQFSLSFASHELNGGVEWTRLYSNNRSVSLSLDILQYNLVQNENAIKTNAINLGISWGIP